MRVRAQQDLSFIRNLRVFALPPSILTIPSLSLPFAPFFPSLILPSTLVEAPLFGYADPARFAAPLPPGSNKSAPLHIPAPNPLSTPLLAPKSMRPVLVVTGRLLFGPAVAALPLLHPSFSSPAYTCVRFSAFRSLGSCSHVKPNRSDTLYAREAPLSECSST